MSSIMRARSALTGRGEGWEVIGGSSLELKVAGPSMLGIGCPGRHALPLTPPQKAPTVTRPPIPRERVRSWGNSRQLGYSARSADMLLQPAVDGSRRLDRCGVDEAASAGMRDHRLPF